MQRSAEYLSHTLLRSQRRISSLQMETDQLDDLKRLDINDSPVPVLAHRKDPFV